MKNLTVKETADRLGISERAVRQRINRKQLPFKRMNRRVFVPENDLNRFLEALPGCSVEEALQEMRLRQTEEKERREERERDLLQKEGR